MTSSLTTNSVMKRTEMPHSGKPDIAAVPICNYEGSTYRNDFWEGQGREYEDLAERIALDALLPGHGQRIAEIGAGFGRLLDMYLGYETVVLADYAHSMLAQARQDLIDAGQESLLLSPAPGKYPRVVLVAADVYNLPFAGAALDSVTTIRMLHHLKDLSAAFAQIARALRPGGTYVLEYANKRNLKNILRFALKRSRANPFDLAPHEFVPLNIDFHPRDIEGRLQHAGFRTGPQRAVSYFRLPALKRRLSPRLLARLDGWLQVPGAPLRLTPSVFMRAQLQGNTTPTGLNPNLFRCLKCQNEQLAYKAEGCHCPQCGTLWPLVEGIYVFKES
ncbi:MAG: class I SAM-dependent methyltransferase [Chloroflexi bacterium]|nr:class I SAM-dependent methyltransferase [Chloroflexota bacterium]